MFKNLYEVVLVNDHNTESISGAKIKSNLTSLQGAHLIEKDEKSFSLPLFILYMSDIEFITSM